MCLDVIKKSLRFVTCVAIVCANIAASESSAAQSLPLDQIRLPQGFSIEIVAPFADIAPEDEGELGGAAVAVFIVDEISEGGAGEVHLFVGHFIQSRDIDLACRILLGEISLVGLLIPFEEVCLIDEIARDGPLSAPQRA